MIAIKLWIILIIWCIGWSVYYASRGYSLWSYGYAGMPRCVIAYWPAIALFAPASLRLTWDFWHFLIFTWE